MARDRDLYAKYMPILLEITAAGWQPLTFAASDNPKVRLERFGEGKTFYLSVFNPTSEAQSARITFDPRAGVMQGCKLVERVEGREINWEGEEVSFGVTIGAEEVRVFIVRKT